MDRHWVTADTVLMHSIVSHGKNLVAVLLLKSLHVETDYRTF